MLSTEELQVDFCFKMIPLGCRKLLGKRQAGRVTDDGGKEGGSAGAKAISC